MLGTPLNIAALSRSRPLVDFLLEAKADPLEYNADAAASRGNPEDAEFITVIRNAQQFKRSNTSEDYAAVADSSTLFNRNDRRKKVTWAPNVRG